jgi:hypothetical protein
MKAIYNKLSLKISVLSLMVFILASCNDFLAEKPSKSSSLVVTTTDQLDAVLSLYTTFWREANRAAISATDDYGYITAMHDAYNGIYGGSGIATLHAGCWDYVSLANASSDELWTSGSYGEWAKIFRANMVLAYADKVSGSSEDKERLKTEAHFIRAYSYWILANTYCLPYTEANKSEPGLPLKSSTSFEESVARSTLEDTYAFIEADIKEALKCTTPLMQNGKARHWRANTAGINGFLARYYLCLNNYTEALKYANNALNEYSTLVDYNTEMYYGNNGNVTIDAGTPQQQSVIIKYPYTHNNQTDYTDRINWKEHLYMRFLYHGSWYYIPSQSLLALYDQQHDLRYRYHIVQHYSYDRGAVKPSYDYPGYVFFFKDYIPSGPTTSEMYLIKAECQARLGSYPDGMNTLNLLRAKRIEPGTWVNLTASNQADAIRQILEERRREKPFTLRWYDLRRYNNNNDPNDDVVVTRTFYPFSSSAIFNNDAPITYTLEKNSRKYALPINNSEIISSNGVLKQNTY